MAPVFRLFLSSPGDAAVERRRAENVVSRLNGEFSGLARLVSVRWETEFYRAHSTFQTQIPPAADCDIVIGILKWRLGTELPPDFNERLPTGEAYPSGTAYELLSAIEKRKLGSELPDVFVFRFTGGSPNPPLDDPNRKQVESDWARLRSFFERWFVTPQGHFVAALNNYETEDQFEKQLETLLRKWLAEKATSGRVVAWPAVKGSPFRGLGVFGAKHAPVLFGRSGDIRRAMDAWREAGRAGAPFLLMLGASGSGKSSLARAGLIPRLTTPGVIPETDIWRIAVVRPGDSREGPFAALAAALLQDESSLPAEEEGRGPALPEIAEGDWRTPADLAALLAQAGSVAVKPIAGALERIGERARANDQYGRALRCDLVLLIDQLEELFAGSVSAETRARFAELLSALVASGRVWLVATLRADFYALLLETPALREVKDRGASYDLAPPAYAELAEIVRAPAQAAGLTFETDPETGESLDERLLREADQPDMLPLVQLALSRLWEARKSNGGETLLPVAAYSQLGGLKGIIDEAGEKAIAGLEESERSLLPALVRRLAELTHSNGSSAPALTARAVPLTEAAHDPASRKLVDALVSARLLTLSGEGDAAQARLAHQRVLTDWARAARIAEESANFYRIRDQIEEQRRRWEEGKRRNELLLARGLPLAEAQNIVANYGAELAPETLAFVAASRRRAQRAQMTAWGLAAVFAILALGAGGAAKIAIDQKTLADRNFAAAKGSVDGLIFDIAQGLRNVSGMRVETIQTILETVKKTVDQLFATAPNDPQLRHSEAVMLSNFALTYMKAGDLKDAGEAANQSLAIDRGLVAQLPNNPEARRELSLILERVGEVKLQSGDQTGAQAAFEEELAIDRALAAESPNNSQAQEDYAGALSDEADVQLQAGNSAAALSNYEAGLTIRRRLAAETPNDLQEQRNLSLSLGKIGDVNLLLGDVNGALAAYQEGLAMAQKLAEQQPDSAQALRDVAVGFEEMGNTKRQALDWPGALAAYQQSLDVSRKLAAMDPTNADAQRDVAADLNKLGDAKIASGDPSGAQVAYNESFAITQKLASQDPTDAQAQRDLSVALNKMAAVRLQSGDKAGALAENEQALAISRKLAAQSPDSAVAQGDLANNLLVVGGLELLLSDDAGALAAYSECLDIRTKLAAQSANTQPQLDLVTILEQLGGVKILSNDPTGALAAYTQATAIARKLVSQNAQDPQFQGALAGSLEKTGLLDASSGAATQALAAYQESAGIRATLAKQAPNDAQAQQDLASDLQALGDADVKAGKPADALAADKELLTIRQALAAKTPSDAKAQTDLLVAFEQAGDLSLQTGDRAGALTLFEEQVATARAAAKVLGNAGQRDLSVALNKLGDTKLAAGDKAGALAAYEDAETLAKTLAASNSSEPLAARDLEVSENKIGDARILSGDTAGALQAYNDAITIARRLAQQTPSDAQAQRDLWVTLNKVGDAQMKAGDRAAAAAAYQEAVALAQHALASEPPTDIQSRTALIISLYKFGEAASPDQARSALTEALTLLKGMQQAKILPAAESTWPDLIQAALNKLPKD